MAVLLMLGGAGAVHAETVTYQYDALGRLVAVVRSNGQVSTYTYDPAGNRTQVTVTTGGGGGLAAVAAPVGEAAAPATLAAYDHVEAEDGAARDAALLDELYAAATAPGSPPTCGWSAQTAAASEC